MLSFVLCEVALRKESVDRNVNLRVLDGSKSSMSLSARRAWIEILTSPPIWTQTARRSPQGERG